MKSSLKKSFSALTAILLIACLIPFASIAETDGSKKADAVKNAVYPLDAGEAVLNGYLLYADSWGEFTESDPASVTMHGSAQYEPTAAAYAGGTVYGFSDDHNGHNVFFTMDTESYLMNYTDVSAPGMVISMAYNHAEGIMYALVFNSNFTTSVYTVNLAVGILEFAADLNANGNIIATLAIDGEGNAYGLNFSLSGNAYLWNIDLATGECTEIGDTGVMLQYIQSMTWDHNTDRLFWAQTYGEEGALYIIDTATAETTLCGQINGVAENVTGLWAANDEPVAPIEVPDFSITFMDGVTGEEIEGGYTVSAGMTLDEADFPEPPVHDGYEFVGWDYKGQAIYDDTVITAKYHDLNEIGFYFETDPAEEGWVWEDRDNDGFNWDWTINLLPKTYDAVPEGEACMVSYSYDNATGAVLTPDNWLISPEVPGGGSVDFLYVANDPNYSIENFGVYASADGGESWSDELGFFTSAAFVQEGHIDLADFAGQNILLAFRHYNSANQFCLLLDAVSVHPAAAPEPPTEEPPTEEPPTEEPPTEEPPTEEPPTETPTEPPAPPTTGFVSLAGMGIASILAGAGIVLFRRKKR